ncbi:hypothetical protein KVH07_10835 [Streptomyces olivaceus]|uniref:hypothetical protein n=1 Tax=Streptomyces TaxID=1883 RepID=UPI001413792C|nr:MULTISPECIES: hypothetical protein [Streptomyces]MBZ6193422.1 hypothetical protein [Streptomyces olivaceus]MBZ6198259.1 hypothetical protein [Streptomyces olivaceus]QIP72015.1 hypothetical protein EZV63_21055 [Streptomyces sp. VN1]
MARNTRTTTAVTLIAAATLLLTACGSGGDTAGVSGPSSSPPPSRTADVNRPDVSLPKDLKLVFDFEKPSDADSAAALDDAANYIRALNHGITEQDAKDPAYGFYSAAGAARYAESQIQEYVDGGWTLTGEDRYYQAGTSPTDEGESIVVTFCEDQSQAYGKEVKTGKVHRTEESPASYQKFSLLMAPQEGSSVWHAQQITVEGKSDACRS